MRSTKDKDGFPKACAVAALAAAALAGCLAGGEPGAAAGGDRVDTRVAFTRAPLARTGAGGEAPRIDSLAIRITGEGMEPLEFSRRGDSLGLTLSGVPAGEERLVQAWLFKSGRALYAGKGVFAFRRESPGEIRLRCDPLFSRVVSRFHLPVDLPAPVRSGTLRLSGAIGQFAAPLRIEDEFGSFLADELPGDARYDVALELADASGAVRYRAERAGVWLPLGEEAAWDLALMPTGATAGLDVGLGEPGEAIATPAFPAGRRAPAKPGELVVGGFYAAPAEKDSGSQGEWFALFNRAGDTLSLAGCRLARERGFGATRSYAFDSLLAIPPGRALSFGRAAAATDHHYADFSLVNTASSLLLLCAGDAALIDSLRYGASPGDSLLPMKEGWVTRLGSGAVSRRERPASWCLARPEAAAPGEWGGCGI